MKRAFKIVLKEIKEENKWGYDDKLQAQVGELVYPFTFKGEDDKLVELKKGDVVLFKDDYPKKFEIEGKEYISTNPNSLICQK